MEVCFQVMATSNHPIKLFYSHSIHPLWCEFDESALDIVTLIQYINYAHLFGNLILDSMSFSK